MQPEYAMVDIQTYGSVIATYDVETSLYIQLRTQRRVRISTILLKCRIMPII